MASLVAQVRKGDLSRIGILSDDDVATLKLFPVRNGVGTWSLELPHLVRSSSGAWIRHAMAEELTKPGAGIVVDLPGGQRFTGPMVAPEFIETTDEPRGKWVFTGVSDSIILADRLAFPNPAFSDAQASSASRPYDIRTGVAETLMHAYVNANIGPSASTSRRDSRLVMGTNLARGTSRTKSARFPSLLELCQELAVADGLLFDVVQVGDKLEFRTSTSSDLSGAIRLDVQSDSLDSAKWGYSGPAATSVVVLGSGEGSERAIRTRTSATATSEAAAWRRVIEVSVDARGAEDTSELDAKGDEVLAANGTRIESLTVVPSAVNTRELGSKWWLGDLVTVNVAGVPVKATVTELAVEVGPEGIYATAKVGDPTGFDSDKITGSRLSGVEGRVSSLERTAEAASSQATAAPPGVVLPFAGGTVPSGALLCNGAAVSRTTYAALFGAIGTAHGAGNGSTTFNLPDYRGRVLVGLDPSQTEFDAIGEAGGAKSVTLTKENLPASISLTATGSDSNTASTTDNGGGSLAQGNTAGRFLKAVTLNNGAAPTAVSNLSPYRVANYIILTGPVNLPGGGTGTVAELPEPLIMVGPAVNVVTASAWGTVVPGTSSVSLTLARPAWVEVSTNAWISAPTGDVRAGVAVSGATVEAANEMGGVVAWGSAMWVTNAYEHRGASKLVRCNAGTSTFALQAYTTGTGTRSVNYPHFTVKPLRWAD